jgi:hypothetical protein
VGLQLLTFANPRGSVWDECKSTSQAGPEAGIRDGDISGKPWRDCEMAISGWK